MLLCQKVCMVKAMIFPVVMDGCENWTIRKAKHQRTDVFQLWCWRRFFRVPLIARRSNQSILKQISPEYALERLMLPKPQTSHNSLLDTSLHSREKKYSSTHQNTDTSFPNQETLTRHLYKPTHSEEMPQ